MTFDMKIAVETQRYLKDAHAEERTAEEILELPRWERVYLWWRALEYYGVQPFPAMTIDTIRKIYGDE